MYYFCLCKSIKELFFELLPHLSARKRMQRYTFLANLQNFSSIFFRKSVFFTFFMESDECQRALHLIIYIISCGVWNEECGVRNVSSTSGLKYEYFISELFSLHTPHSTLHKTTPHSTKLLHTPQKKHKTVDLFCDFFVLLQLKSYRRPGAARLLQ